MALETNLNQKNPQSTYKSSLTLQLKQITQTNVLMA